MSFQSLSNEAIAKEIGSRIEQMRLEQNMTQAQLAEEIGISRISYRNLVNGGNGKFINIIAALRVLGCLDLLEGFIPEAPFSPIEMLKLQGKKRQRASRSQHKADGPDQPNSEALDW